MRVKGKLGITLTILTGVGIAVTIYLTSKKAPEAQKLKESALEKKRKDTGNENAQLTLMESIQAQAPCYGPAIGVGLLTFASLIGNQVISEETIREFNRFKTTYQKTTAKLVGQKEAKMIDKIVDQKISESTDGKKLETFVLIYGDQYIEFESTLLDVLTAEYEVNRCFRLNTKVTFNDFLMIFHIDKHLEDGDDVGWEEVLGSCYYGYTWIDFTHRRSMWNGKPVTFIDMPFQCHSLSEDEVVDAQYNSELTNHGIEGMW